MRVQHQTERARQLRARLAPSGLFKRHARLARAAGIDSVLLVLSFDCDTPEDASVAGAVNDRLLGMGVRASWAVPGELLRNHADQYAPIARSGSEFLNHGGRSHTYFNRDHDRWASCFFYDEQPLSALRDDIRLGDEAVREVTGRKPTGFRVPHFGTFQSASQLQFLRATLAGLDYEWSSSTVPRQGFRRGPVFRDGQIAELPVSGGGLSPLRILDTWGHFEAPDRDGSPQEYLREAISLGEHMAAAGAGVINLYGDPSHIHASEEFYEAIAALRSIAPSRSLGEIVAATS